MATQEMGQVKAKRDKKPLKPKNFRELFMDARHISEDGWDGITAEAFRKAMVSACRCVPGVFMSTAQQAITGIVPQGYDKTSGVGLVKIHGRVRMRTDFVKINKDKPDIRARPAWRKWSAVVDVEYDADMLSQESITNLMTRAGFQVGVGEGRPGSKSGGIGCGRFKIKDS